MADRSLMIEAIENDRQAFYERLFEKYAQLDAATNQAEEDEDEAQGSFALSDDEDWDVSDFHIPSPIPIRNEHFQEYVRSHTLYTQAQSVLGGVGLREEEPTQDIIINCFGSDTEESSETDEDSPGQNRSPPWVDPSKEKTEKSTLTPILPWPRTTPRARRNICPLLVDEIVLSPPAKAQTQAISPVAPKRSTAKSPIGSVKNGPESPKKTAKLNKKQSSGKKESVTESTPSNPKSPKVPPFAKANHDTPQRSSKKSPQTPRKQRKAAPASPKIVDQDPPAEPALKGSSKAMTVKGRANSPQAKKTTKATPPGPIRSSPRLREKSQNLSALDETSSDIENASPSSELPDLSNRSFVFGRADSLSIIKKAQLNQMKSRSFVTEVQETPKKRPPASLSQTLAPSQQLNIVLGRPGSLAPLRSAQDEQLSKDSLNRRDANRSLSVLDEMFQTPRRGTRNNSNRSNHSASLFQPRDSSVSVTPTFEDFQHPLLQSAKLNRLRTPEGSRSPQSPFESTNRHLSPLTRNSSMISTSTFPEAEGSVCSVSSSVKRFRLRKKKTVT